MNNKNDNTLFIFCRDFTDKYQSLNFREFSMNCFSPYPYFRVWKNFRKIALESRIGILQDWTTDWTTLWSWFWLQFEASKHLENLLTDGRNVVVDDLKRSNLLHTSLNFSLFGDHEIFLAFVLSKWIEIKSI